jgi:demethylmenaquinone methyltransferase/2-methoxy-6-polyprenyl-1,4-benzoquinol methylase
MDSRVRFDFETREDARLDAFRKVWDQHLDDVFDDVADYYDQANRFASLGQWDRLMDTFIPIIDPRPNERVLDVCAGTNAVGIAMLERESALEVHAMDRSEAMQRVGTRRANAHGFEIQSHIGDVHRLPFPDDHFDLVTLQWASRHLRVVDVFSEIRRVLKPGGRFCHGDMLRPESCLVEGLYYTYLRGCLTLTGLVYGSGRSALDARRYFIKALRMFYSSRELAELLRLLGFTNVSYRDVLLGTMAFHRAYKAES